jgi:hypothetical protein
MPRRLAQAGSVGQFQGARRAAPLFAPAAPAPTGTAGAGAVFRDRPPNTPVRPAARDLAYRTDLMAAGVAARDDERRPNASGRGGMPRVRAAVHRGADHVNTLTGKAGRT